MSARERILHRVRDACDHGVSRPEPGGPESRGAGWASFTEALEAAGGSAHDACPAEELPERLRRLAGGGGVVPAAGRAAALPGTARPPSDPEELDGLPLLVAPAGWAIARTGTVAVGHRDVPVRAHLLLPERLVVVVDAGRLVPDLPALYRRLSREERGGAGYLTLITGPSKTADIGQVLVEGAHGPRALDVIPVTGLLTRLASRPGG